ncbi:PaaI family thioesterase [Aquihabitans daechungensis]|uniref:PaaI family thioesterase n=1 Tax=Aquihabitans daechungensis TaxID=1052257 RepID=UPI003BA0A47F
MTNALTHVPPPTRGEHPETAFPAGPGLELMRSIQRGETAPIPAARFLNVRITRVAAGTIWFEFIPDSNHANPVNVLDGILSAVANLAAAAAAMTVVPAGATVSSTDLHVSFLRDLPVTADAAQVVASVVHLGPTQVNCNVSMTGPDGRSILLASSTARIVGQGSAR